MKLQVAKLVLLILTIPFYVIAGGVVTFNLDISVSNFPDTVYQNQAIDFNINLTNNDTGGFNEKVYINYMITDTLPANFPDDLDPDFKDSISVLINPGNVYVKNKNLTINPIYFEGNKKNIIIIWPTATTINIDFNMDIKEIRVEWPVGMNNLENNQFNIYPNPSSNLTRIDFPKDFSNGSLSIYSLDGRLINEVIIPEHSEYFDYNNTSSEGSLLSNGMYFVAIKNNRISAIKKLIISR